MLKLWDVGALKTIPLENKNNSGQSKTDNEWQNNNDKLGTIDDEKREEKNTDIGGSSKKSRPLKMFPPAKEKIGLLFRSVKKLKNRTNQFRLICLAYDFLQNERKTMQKAIKNARDRWRIFSKLHLSADRNSSPNGGQEKLEPRRPRIGISTKLRIAFSNTEVLTNKNANIKTRLDGSKSPIFEEAKPKNTGFTLHEADIFLMSANLTFDRC